MSAAQRDRTLVTRRLPGDGAARLGQTAFVDVWPGDDPMPRDELLERVRGVAALVSTINERVDAEVLDSAGPTLRIVSNVAVGVDNIDVDACTSRGVLVGHTPGVLTDTTAETAMALILATSRRLVEAADAVRAGEWPAWTPTWMCGLDLLGATLGIVGYGAIGRAVARRAEAFGMHVIHHDPLTGGVSFDELLAQADVVSLHCPLTPETRGLISTRELARMKPTAVLVNTARGPIVDPVALADALRAGEIRAAGLDVTVVEPVPLDDPLLRLPNCIVLPHIGSATIGTRERMADLAIDNARAALAGEPPPHAVNAAEVDGRR